MHCAKGTAGIRARGFLRGAQSAVNHLQYYADDFLTDYEPGVTADLVHAFAQSGKLQLSVMEVDGLLSQNMELLCGSSSSGIMGLVENLLQARRHRTLHQSVDMFRRLISLIL